MTFVKVILPLKLDWEPFYKSDSDLKRGDRVCVNFAGRNYIAVVSESGVEPDIDASRIRNIVSAEDALEPVSEAEIAFWRFLSEYYLCTPGEVYKLAYPATRTEAERRKARAKKPASSAPDLHPRFDASAKETLKAVLAGFDEAKPVLLHAGSRDKLYSELVRRCLEAGKSALLLAPGRSAEAWEGSAMVYTVGTSASERRNIASAVRSGGPVFVAGGPGALLLPWNNLGLIIVDAEESPLHRREMTAPHFNARDAAVWLAASCGASILLGSDFPSMESSLNAVSGKYVKIEAPAAPAAIPEIIDTAAEWGKNGMNGSFSLKLLERMRSDFEARQRVLLLLPWNDTDNIEIEARALFPKVSTRLSVLPLRKATPAVLARHGLVALLAAEFMLKGDDFRTDEKAFRALSALCRDAGESPLLIQCAQAGHTVLRSLLLAEDAAALPAFLLRERAAFGLPPYSRIVDVVLSDKNEKRLRWFLGELSERLAALPELSSADVKVQAGRDRIRIILPRNASLSARKRGIYSAVTTFCTERNYFSHLTMEVDPL